MKKLAYVDALRGFAIILVIISHSSQCGINNYGYLLTTLFNKAEYGVQLFYIASAFTIFLSYTNRINKEISPAKNFFIRRFFRIAPMYYIAIAFYLWQTNSWIFNVPFSCPMILSQIFFVHGFHPIWMNSIVPGGWSVGLEMMFYALIPVLFYFIKDLNSAIVFFILSIILQFTLNSILIQSPPINDINVWARFLYCYLPNQLPVFALGIILFHFIKKETGSLIIKPFIILLLSILILVHFYFDIMLISNFIFITIGFVSFAYYLSKEEKSILINPIITYIGKISYSMYLVHFAVLEFMIKLEVTDILNDGNHYTLNFLLRFLVVLIVSLILSTISFYIIEKPMQKAGGKIIELLENVSILPSKELS